MHTEPEPVSDESRIEALGRYFWAPPSPPQLPTPVWVGILIVLILVVFGFTEALGAIVGTLLGLLALPVMALATLSILEPQLAERLTRALVASRKALPDDTQVDAWIEESLRSAVDYSRQYLTIPDEEVLAYPVTSTEAVAREERGLSWTRLAPRKGRDGIERHPELGLRVFWITSRRIASFHCVVDLVHREFRQERAHEYSPADIAAVGIDRSRSASGPSDRIALEVRFKNGDRERIQVRSEALAPRAVSESAVLTMLRSALQGT